MAPDVAGFWQLRRDEQATSLDPQTINTAILTHLLDVHTAIPGIIDKFDSKKQTAEVRPAIKMLYIPDPQIGESQWIERSLCVDVPVIFPGCGDYVLTFPVNQGDECLLVFNERTIDHWFTEGGVQEQADIRHHDASDAVAIVGLRSQKHNIEDFDEDNAQLRNMKGDTTITLDKDGTITVDVKDSSTLTVDDSTITAQIDGTKMVIEDGKVTVTADSIKLDGDVEVTGDLDVGGDVSGDGSADFTDDVSGAGISLQNHIHTGVQSGAGTSGPPQ